MEDSEKITLKNMAYSGYLGVAEWESDVKTHIEVDLEIYANLKKACKSDDLDDTIDYAAVYDLVGKVIKGGHHHLLESLADEIADEVFQFCDCSRIVVRTRKPHPPVSGMCDYAEVEIVRNNISQQ
jgi:dihydroneopterin aldolase